MQARLPTACAAMLLTSILGISAAAQTIAPARSAEPSLPRAPVRNAPIASYTFDLDARIAMRTFPWLKFHISGKGRYELNGDLMLHLIGMPRFAKSYQDVNMASVLEPQTWSRQYTIASAQRHGGTVTLVMHDRRKTPLTEARATIDEDAGLRELDWDYSYGGRIRLSVLPVDVSGYSLPGTMNVEADMPRYAATAHATFSNYHVVTDEKGSTAAR